MYQKKSNIQTLMVLVIDCLCITISLLLANYIRNGRFFDSDNARMNLWLMLGACLTVFLGMNLLHSSNKDFFLRGPLHELTHVVRGNLFMLAAVAIILYFLNLIDAYSRIVFFLFAVIDCILMVIMHQLWKKLLPSFYRYFGETRKLLIVADREYAENVIRDVSGMKDFTYELIGIILVKATSAESEVEGIPVVACEDDLIDYCRSASLDEVVVAVDDSIKEEFLPRMEAMAQMGITVHAKIAVPELKYAGQKVLSRFGQSYMITYANKVAPVGQIFLKRLLDVCGAVVGCIFLLFMTVILGPAIKLESPGPVFFAQKRVGRNGRIFKMYKFRSMYVDAEERKKELMEKNEMNGLMFKMENDPRITKVGRFMRKTSLDEFPQFINILKGDMSLVGTRPPTLDEFAQYSPYHKKRLSFRPGLTGMWQVSGRSTITDFEEIVGLDVEYIDNWSFMLDVKILLKTVLAVFHGSGAM